MEMGRVVNLGADGECMARAYMRVAEVVGNMRGTKID